MRFFWLVLAAGWAATTALGQDEADLKDPNYWKNNRPPEIVEWQDPVYPPELAAEKKGGFARVRFTIEKDGTISDLIAAGGNDDRFRDAAVAAVRKWKFSAGITKGQLERGSCDIHFRFDPQNPTFARKSASKSALPPEPYRLESSPFRDPVERSCPDPTYPKELVHRQLAGEVEAQLGIDENGKVIKARIIRSSYAEFTEVALRTVAGWEFIPAGRGTVPAKGEKKAMLNFVVVDTETDRQVRNRWLERNGITLREDPGQTPETFFEEFPRSRIVVDPVYPFELAQEGKPGTARVNFRVDVTGRVIEATVVEASEPRFGASLAAAISSWAFEPLEKGGQKIAADFSIAWKFEPPAETTIEHHFLHETGEKPLTNAKSLDHPPTPVCLVPPVYPEKLLAERITGEANVEIFIDRNGRARCPRIVDASRPELGWAAATAASQWFFEPLRRGGEPVELRVVVPFSFNPEAAAGADQ